MLQWLLVLPLLVGAQGNGGDAPPEVEADQIPQSGAGAGNSDTLFDAQQPPVCGAELYDALYDAYNQLHTYSQQARARSRLHRAFRRCPSPCTAHAEPRVQR